MEDNSHQAVTVDAKVMALFTLTRSIACVYVHFDHTPLDQSHHHQKLFPHQKTPHSLMYWAGKRGADIMDWGYCPTRQHECPSATHACTHICQQCQVLWHVSHTRLGGGGAKSSSKMSNMEGEWSGEKGSNSSSPTSASVAFSCRVQPWHVTHTSPALSNKLAWHCLQVLLIELKCIIT